MPVIYRPGGLDFIKMKTDRAKAHLDELDTEIKQFINDDPYSIATKDDVELRHIIRIEVKPMREIIGMLIGEFAYSLRSGLDQLAWQLAYSGPKNSDQAIS